MLVGSAAGICPFTVRAQQATLGPLQQMTRTVPIIFVRVTDPVGAGYVASLAHPGGNATGFAIFEYGISGKWLGLLKEIAPRVTRIAVLRDSTLPSGAGQFGALQSAAAPLGLELTPFNIRDVNLIDSGLAAFASVPNGGMIVVGSAGATVHRKLIIELAARYRLPAIYPYRYVATEGGLVSYGPDITDPYRRAAGYVHRVLGGEHPSNLPVQAETKFELVINLKTAKTLGLTVPTSLLSTADEVIE
jgi:putative ABC transport system substrate-binding protein